MSLPDDVGYWKLDKCGLYNDSSRFGVTGTGVAGVGCALGRYSPGASFDGVGSMIVIPDQPQYHFSHSMTASAWINPTVTTGTHTIIDKWYTPDAYFLGIDGGRLTYRVALADGWHTAVGGIPPIGAWTHVAGVFDGATVALYVNGQPVASTPAVGQIADSSQNLAIGNYPPWDAFAGRIDEVRLFNLALTASQVPLLTMPTPLAHWRFEDCGGPVFADATRNGADGANSGGVTCEPGAIGAAAKFDGVSGMVQVNDQPYFHFTQAMTVSAWVNIADATGDRTILNKWYAPDSYFLGIEGGQLMFRVNLADGWHTAAVQALTNQWIHVAGVFDGSSVSLYVNGQRTAFASAIGTLVDSSQPLVIGNHPSWNAFAGRIDEVQLFSTALSAAQVRTLAALPERGQALENYLATLPPAWQSRMRDAVTACSAAEGTAAAGTTENRVYRIPVLSLRYFPVHYNGAEWRIDASIAGPGTDMSLVDMRKKVYTLADQLRWALENSSMYHALADSLATCSIEYDIVKEAEYLEPLAPGFPVGVGTYYPDYNAILQREDICRLVNSYHVQQVWLWGYQNGNIVPAESNMAGPYGNISNSFRYNNMPVCGATYTLFNYNYGRALGEAHEDHGHQVEALFQDVDMNMLWWNNFARPYYRFDGLLTPQFCGNTHTPPNGVTNYDWRNTTVVNSDCLDWNPSRTGAKQTVSCLNWTCNDDGGATYKVWWMMLFPGKNNALLDLSGKPLRNWWDVVGDFDAVKASGTGLLR